MSVNLMPRPTASNVPANRDVILSAAKDLTRRTPRSFAALRMTFGDQSREAVTLET